MVEPALRRMFLSLVAGLGEAHRGASQLPIRSTPLASPSFVFRSRMEAVATSRRVSFLDSPSQKASLSPGVSVSRMGSGGMTNLGRPAAEGEPGSGLRLARGARLRLEWEGARLAAEATGERLAPETLALGRSEGLLALAGAELLRVAVGLGWWRALGGPQGTEPRGSIVVAKADDRSPSYARVASGRGPNRLRPNFEAAASVSRVEASIFLSLKGKEIRWHQQESYESGLVTGSQRKLPRGKVNFRPSHK